MVRRLVGAMALVSALAFANTAFAGSIYLTGHDVLLHDGQNDYDNLILDFLRGDGTASEIAAGDYDMLLVRGFAGSVGSLGINTLEGFGTVTVVDIADFADDASLTAALAGIEVLVIPDHTSCGGCDLTDEDADVLEARSAAITSYFNAGGDLFVGSGAADTTFYNFLPAGAVASGLPIGGSSGFVATAAGLAIGIQNNMINGFPTHNRFASFDSDFVVMETRPQTGAPDEIISLAIRDARIIADDGIVTDDGTTDDGTVPEPATLALLGSGLVGLAAARRRRRGQA